MHPERDPTSIQWAKVISGLAESEEVCFIHVETYSKSLAENLARKGEEVQPFDEAALKQQILKIWGEEPRCGPPHGG